MLMSWVLLFLVSVQGCFITIQLRFRRFRGFVFVIGSTEAVKLLQRPSVGSTHMDIVSGGL